MANSSKERDFAEELELPIFPSSRELDEKILAFAQQHLPSRPVDKPWRSFSPFLAQAGVSVGATANLHRQAAWLTGFVAVSIVCIATIITASWLPEKNFKELYTLNNVSPGIVPPEKSSIEKQSDVEGDLTSAERAFLDRTLLLALDLVYSGNTLGASAGVVADNSFISRTQFFLFRKSLPLSERYVQRYMAILASLVEKGHDELANLYYKKLLLACPQCELPDQLSDALSWVNSG